MKKIILATIGILLLAAACNKQAAVQPAQNQQASNLKTHTSNLGYSVDYPSDWTINATESIVSVSPPNPGLDNGMPPVYFEVQLAEDSLGELREVYGKNVGGQNTTEVQIIFAGEKGYAYCQAWREPSKKW